LLTLRSSPKLGDRPLSVVCDCLFGIFAASGVSYKGTKTKTEEQTPTHTELRSTYIFLFGNFVNTFILLNPNINLYKLVFSFLFHRTAASYGIVNCFQRNINVPHREHIVLTAHPCCYDQNLRLAVDMEKAFDSELL